jgi:hypothetical protein
MKRYFLWLSMLMLLTACNQGDAGSERHNRQVKNPQNKKAKSC